MAASGNTGRELMGSQQGSDKELGFFSKGEESSSKSSGREVSSDLEFGMDYMK